jgi:hypothetical protein
MGILQVNTVGEVVVESGVTDVGGRAVFFTSFVPQTQPGQNGSSRRT